MRQVLPIRTAAFVFLSALTTAVSAGDGSWPSVQPVPGKQSWMSSVGNHRWVIKVEDLPAAAGRAVLARIPWRRRDSDPLSKDSFVISTASQLKVPHCSRVHADSAGESATYVFEAMDGPGEYHLYYMPFETCEYGACQYDVQLVYQGNLSGGCADGNWFKGQDPAPAASVEYQPRDTFQAFAEEEKPATADERRALASRVPSTQPVVLVTEDRSRPIRMRRQVPYTWSTREGALNEFRGSSQPGERYSMQIGLWALRTVNVTGIRFSDLVDDVDGSRLVSKSHISCMNFEGFDFWGQPYSASAVVPADHVLPMWVAIRIPSETAEGTYSGRAFVELLDGRETLQLPVQLTIHISGPALDDGGDSELWRGTRLTWLDSRLAQDEETVPPPYTALSVAGCDGTCQNFEVAMLDKVVRIAANGLPDVITVGTAAGSFPQSNLVKAEALASPMELRLLSSDGAVSLKPESLAIIDKTNMKVSWKATLTTEDGTSLVVAGSVDCTGYLDYQVEIGNASRELNFVLTMPAKGIMATGLGLNGDYLENMPPAEAKSEWFVLDMGREVTAEAVGLHLAGDGIHDPTKINVQIATSGDGPWQPVAMFLPKPDVTAMQSFSFGDQSVVSSRYWRILITEVARSSNCHPAQACQAWVAEVQLKDRSLGWLQNHGSAAKPMIVASSGSRSKKNPAWMVADGILTFKLGEAGWDASDMPLLPAGLLRGGGEALVIADWKWDGVNGNNAVWVGSSAAGLRLFPRGADPFWQAAVPYDSKASPPPPQEWANHEKGGIRLFQNGTVQAYTGLAAPGAKTLRFSIVPTPVRPLNLTKHYQERYAQLGGGANYSFLAEQGATIVVMHQGNPLNPWINYPYLTNHLLKSAADECHRLGLKFKIYVYPCFSSFISVLEL
eukprot:TRINITY_DN25968_c0_g1_i2.p1 TRINITY_DN25968_c0_g1~~TRINITY_DN25968_c0_g1_i2.p1  ORF type:complete len:917 (-),score=130.85 TRINITY_DN25968_c0_g1_i2:263-2962(-)